MLTIMGNISTVLIGLLLLSGTFIQGKSVQDESSSRIRQSSSRSGSRLRVMIHKEFQLQSDGSYKEIPSSGDKKLTLVHDENEGEEVAESAPPVVYSRSYFSSPPQKTYSRVSYNSPLQYDSVPQSSYFRPQFTQADASSSFQSSDVTYPDEDLPKSSFARELLSGTGYRGASNVTGAESANYQRYDISPIPSSQYYVDEIRPGGDYRSHFSKSQQVSNVQGGQSGGYNNNNNNNNKANGPANIQEILKKPAESVQSHYYTPKDNFQYYDTTGGSGDYGAPVSGYQDSYGPPPVGSTGGYDDGNVGGGYVTTGGHDGGSKGGYVESGGYGGGSKGGYSGGHGGGGGGGIGKGNVVGSLLGTVKGVAGHKAAQFGNIVQQKGEVGTQILNQGGKIVQSAVEQKANKAKAIGNVLAQAPRAITSVIGAKAQLASSAIQYGTNTVGTIVRVKAQAAHQAAELIGAKGKAASAVIKATGGTAADLIVAKGKGLANLIRSGGKTATAILDSKGNTVQQIASVLAGKGKGGGGYSGGYNGGGGSVSTSYGGDLGGGFGSGGDGWNDWAASAPAPQIAQYGERNTFEELQSALKSVAESPASSYGSPPTEKLSSAFRSMYDSYMKNGMGNNNPVGAFSSPVGVATAPASASSEDEYGGESLEKKHSATSIGDSLSKISKVFNNVATVLEKFNAPKSQ